MKYEKAESKVIEFESEDIITASSAQKCNATSTTGDTSGGCTDATQGTIDYAANPMDFIKF